jgi:hypothetical protein
VPENGGDDERHNKCYTNEYCLYIGYRDDNFSSIDNSYMREINFKAGLETFIIALFVIAGVKVASIISSWLP